MYGEPPLDCIIRFWLKATARLQFKLNQVIRGWQEALQLLKPGGKGVFLIPSRIAYGARGFGDEIPPHSPLIFTVELVKNQTN